MPAGMDSFGARWAEEPRPDPDDPYYKLCAALDGVPDSAFADDDLERRLTWKGRIKLRRLGEYAAYDGETIVAYVGSNRKVYEYNPLTRGRGRFRKMWLYAMDPVEQNRLTALLDSVM